MTTITLERPAAAVDVDAEQIAQAHVEAIAAAMTALERGIECGRLLTEAKARHPYGEWLPWLAAQREQLGDRFPAERTAQAYMRLYRRRADLLANPHRVADLSVRGALDLLRDRQNEATRNSWSSWDNGFAGRMRDFNERFTRAHEAATYRWADGLKKKNPAESYLRACKSFRTATGQAGEATAAGDIPPESVPEVQAMLDGLADHIANFKAKLGGAR